MSNPAPPQNASDRRHPTVLFADISGFTAMSEKMDPEDVADAMNGCFKLVERIVLSRGGTIDKYIGDAVMALFGAPKALEHAPRQALNAAIEIRNAIADYGEKQRLPAKLGAHIGVNTGLVLSGDMGGEVRRDYTVMGKTVNMAARLEGAAVVGQIFVGSATYHATRRDFEFRRLENLKLKGIDHVEAYELLSENAQTYRARPGMERHGLISPLVGREHEIEVIRSRLDDLQEGRGGVATIVAENGMGKSRLLAEIEQLEEAEAIPFHEGRALHKGEGLVFHPFADLLRSLSGSPSAEDLPDALSALVAKAWPDAPEETFAILARMMGLELNDEMSHHIADISGDALEKAIHRSVAQLLRQISRDNPVVIVMEDLHWADLSSMSLLESVLPLAGEAPILFLLVARVDYKNTNRVMDFLRERLDLRHAHLRLTPLTAASSSALIENLLGSGDLPQVMRERVKRRAEGNPFYIEEVLRALIDQQMIALDKGQLRVLEPLADFEIPATIEEVILSRVDHLEPESARVVQVASVIGRRFQRRVLEEMLPDHEDLDSVLEDLTTRQLVAPIASRATGRRRVVSFKEEIDYTFKHALIQEAVYGALLKKDRKPLHASCATAIEKLYSDHLQDAFAMLARHYASAEELEKAEEYTFRAGEEAAKAAASNEALLHFEEAHRLYMQIHGDHADLQKRAILEKNIAQALFNIGNLSESVEHFDSSLEHFGVWVPKPGPSQWLKLAYDMGAVFARMYLAGNRYGASDREEDRHIVEAMYNRARAENITHTTRAFFDTVGTPRYLRRLDPTTCEYSTEIVATSGAFFAFAGLSPAVGRRFLSDAQELIRPDHASDVFSHQAMRMVVEFHAGDWSEDLEIDEKLLERGVRAGRVWGADVYLGMLAERNIRQGRFQEVHRQLELLARLQTDYGYEFASSNAHAMAAFLLVEQRLLDDARIAMQAYYDSRHEDSLHVLALSGLAKIACLDARLEDAERALAEAERILENAGRVPPFYLGAYRTSRLLVDATRLEHEPSRASRRAAKNSSKHATAVSRSIARERVEALRLTGRVHRLLGRKSQAFSAWNAALEEAEKLGAEPEAARTSLEVAEALGGTWPGETFRNDGAPHWLARALGAFDRLDIPFDLENARSVAESCEIEWHDECVAKQAVDA